MRRLLLLLILLLIVVPLWAQVNCSGGPLGCPQPMISTGLGTLAPVQFGSIGVNTTAPGTGILALGTSTMTIGTVTGSGTQAIIRFPTSLNDPSSGISFQDGDISLYSTHGGNVGIRRNAGNTAEFSVANFAAGGYAIYKTIINNVNQWDFGSGATNSGDQHFEIYNRNLSLEGLRIDWTNNNLLSGGTIQGTALGAGVAPGAAGTLKLTNKLALYNNNVPAGLGQEYIAGSAVLTSTTTAVTTTNLVASVPANSMYTVRAALTCDTTSAAATVNITIGWTDPSNTPQTAALGSAVACTALGASSFGSLTQMLSAKSGTAITYSTSIVNTPTYDVRVIVLQGTSN